MMKRLFYIILFCAVPSLLMAGEFVDNGKKVIHTKEAGDSAYSQKRFKDALDIYESLIEEGGGTVELHYNLANAAYRMNMLGKAILNYERALRLDPSDEDVKANLEFVRTKIKDEIPETYEFFIVAWFRDLANLAGADAWAVTGVVSFVLTLAAGFFLLFGRRRGMRIFAIAVVVLSLFVTIFANIAAYTVYESMNDKGAAIVIKEEVSLKSTPDNSGTVLIKVHEGRKVKVVDDTMRGWKEIELENGKIGWVQSATIEVV